MTNSYDQEHVHTFQKIVPTLDGLKLNPHAFNFKPSRVGTIWFGFFGGLKHPVYVF